MTKPRFFPWFFHARGQLPIPYLQRKGLRLRHTANSDDFVMRTAPTEVRGDAAELPQRATTCACGRSDAHCSPAAAASTAGQPIKRPFS